MNANEPRLEARLESWKEIGAYLQRDSTTARRWEKEEGLPVHRHTHKSRSSVYAYPSEIDAWRAGRKIVAEPTPRPLWKTLLTGPRSLAFGVAMASFLIMVGNGVRPQVASAEDSGKGARQIWLPGDKERPSPSSLSSDGRYVSFSDETGDLGIRDLMMNATRRLTDTKNWEAYAGHSVISADNRMIAYNWTESGRGTEIRVVPINGGAHRTIRRTQGLQDFMEPWGWTPDGKQLLALHFTADRTKQIAMVSIADGSVHVVKSEWWMGIGDQLRLSPDGRWIAYSTRAQGQLSDRDVAILSTDGKSETLISGPSDDSEPFWSDDGLHLLFLSNRTGNVSLWAVSVQNGKVTGDAALVKADMTRIEPLGFARSGAFVYVHTGQRNPNIYVARPDSDGKFPQPAALAIETYIGANQGPRLSPDGDYLAYYSSRPQMALVIRTLKTGEERVVPAEVTPAVLHDYGPMWFPDGRSVLVASAMPKPGAYRVDIETGKAELVWPFQRPIEMYALSPDGKAIYYTEPVPGNQNQFVTTRLLRYEIVTQRATELKSGEWIMSPALSRDSKQLAYMVTFPSSEEGYVAVMPAGGGDSRELFRGPWAGTSRPNSIAWSPDQRHIYFVTGGPLPDRPNTLWRVPAAGGAVERIAGLGPGLVRSPQLFADGSIFFSINATSPSELWTEKDLLTRPNPGR